MRGGEEGGTAYRQAEVAARPEIWLTYGVTCLGVSLSCIAGTLGADVYDAVGSMAACGIPAAVGYMQGGVIREALLNAGWTQFPSFTRSQIYSAGLTGLGGSILSSTLRLWRGGSTRAWALRGHRLWGVAYRNIDPVRIIAQDLAEDEIARYVNALADAIKETTRRRGVYPDEIEGAVRIYMGRAGVVKISIGDRKLTANLKKVGVEEPATVVNRVSTALGLKPEELTKMEDALQKFVKGGAAVDDTATIMKYVDAQTLKAALKSKLSDDVLRVLAKSLGVSLKEGEDLAEAVAKAIENADERAIKAAFERLRSMPPLKIPRGQWKKYAKELGKPFVTGVFCDFVGGASGAFAASAIWTTETAWAGIPTLSITRLSAQPVKITVTDGGTNLQIELK